MKVAALFVDPRGPYFGRPDVDAWDDRLTPAAFVEVLLALARLARAEAA